MTITLPKGKYYIGDPLYIFTHKDYVKFLAQLDPFQDVHSGTFNGNSFVVGLIDRDCDTCNDNKNNEYFVHSKILGIFAIGMLKNNNKVSEEQIRDLSGSTIQQFNREFEVSIEDGVFTFGSLTINTKANDTDF